MRNAYARSVTHDGNQPAQAVIRQVFEMTDRAWRGIGVIPMSGYRLREEFASFDAEQRFPQVQSIETHEVAALHQRAGAAGPQETRRMPGFRQAMHPADPARRDHGFFGGRLRGLLSLWALSFPSPTGERVRGEAGMTEKLNLLGWTCPRPLQNYPTIVMGHGAGGGMMADLIEHLFAPAFDNEWLGQMGDSAS